MVVDKRELSEPEVKAYINDMKKLLREIQPILGRAFFANFKDQDKADELRCKIDQIVEGRS